MHLPTPVFTPELEQEWPDEGDPDLCTACGVHLRSWPHGDRCTGCALWEDQEAAAALYGGLPDEEEDVPF